MVAGAVEAHSEFRHARRCIDQVRVAVYEARKYPLAMATAQFPAVVGQWTVRHGAKRRNFSVHHFDKCVAHDR